MDICKCKFRLIDKFQYFIIVIFMVKRRIFLRKISTSSISNAWERLMISILLQNIVLRRAIISRESFYLEYHYFYKLAKSFIQRKSVCAADLYGLGTIIESNSCFVSFKGKLMQIWKSPYMFCSYKKISWIFFILNLKNSGIICQWSL